VTVNTHIFFFGLKKHCLTYLLQQRITRDGVEELSKVLQKNTAIETLDLGFNRLEDDGAIHIANALATLNTNLKT
jgi:hypothetical protein